MGRPSNSALAPKSTPFFGEWQPIAMAFLLLLAGLVAVTTFYASVFAAAQVVATDNGVGREQLKVVSLWVFALFLVQGLVPLLRFGINDLPRLMIGGFQVKPQDIGMFFLLVVGGVFLLFG